MWEIGIQSTHYWPTQLIKASNVNNLRLQSQALALFSYKLQSTEDQRITTAVLYMENAWPQPGIFGNHTYKSSWER